MTVHGRVKNGVVVLPPGHQLPEGAEVRVDALPPGETGSLLDSLGDLVGSITDLPEDYALNHEHYRFGTPRR